MPHITLEQSANIAKRPNESDLLKKLHAALIASDDSFKIQDVKSRILKHESFQVADGTKNQSFVHLQLAIMPRDEAVKAKAAAALMSVLKESFAGNENCSLSVEIRTLEKASYAKAAL